MPSTKDTKKIIRMPKKKAAPFTSFWNAANSSLFRYSAGANSCQNPRASGFSRFLRAKLRIAAAMPCSENRNTPVKYSA